MALSLLQTILGARDIYEDVSRFVRASKSGKKAMRSYLLWTIALISTGAVAMHVLPQLCLGRALLTRPPCKQKRLPITKRPESTPKKCRADVSKIRFTTFALSPKLISYLKKGAL